MILQSAETSNPPLLLNPTRISHEELHRRVTYIRYDLTTGDPIPFPTLDSAQALQGWLQRIEKDLKEADVPQAQWSDAAILFLEGSVNMAIRKMRQRRVELGFDLWSWDQFTAALLDLLIERESHPTGFQKFRKDHPVAATVAGTGLVIVGGAVLGPAIIVGGLNAVGFTSGGVAAGSAATTIQSIFYGGATSGLFSLCQSIGATAVAASPGAVISALGSIAAGAGLIRRSNGQNEETSDSSESIVTDSSSSLPPYQP